MTTGTKSKGTEPLLKVAIGICILFALANFVGLIYSHIPPYDAGQCLAVSKTIVNVKIEENHVLAGYSDIELKNAITGQTKKGPIMFTELRNPAFKVQECK